MITRSQLETVLEQWRLEYGYGECSELVTDDICAVGVSGRPVPIGTLADEFNAAWLRLSGGNTREWRMAMALKADVFCGRGDPMDLILQRLRAVGVSMAEQEFTDHAEWGRRHFCQVLTIRKAA